MSKYRKFIIAGFGAAVAIATHFAGADSDPVFVIVALATALGVYAVPNSG